MLSVTEDRISDAGDTMLGRILDAAYDEILDFGMRGATVEDVARRAGIARITVYRRFANKDELIRAVLLREGRRLFDRVDAVVTGLPSPEDQLVEGFVAILGGVRRHPLVQRVVATEPDVALPMATVDAAPIIAAARHYLAGHLRRTRRRDHAEEVAELAVRLTLSYLLTPEGCIPLDSDDDARTFARRYLLPLLRTP